jgi:hypothetical protein
MEMEKGWNSPRQPEPEAGYNNYCVFVSSYDEFLCFTMKHLKILMHENQYMMLREEK